MLEFTNATCEPQGERIKNIETVKMILDNTDEVLNELDNQTTAIEASIFGPKPSGPEPNSDPIGDCVLGTLGRQRGKAEEILKRVLHIREGLW